MGIFGNGNTSQVHAAKDTRADNAKENQGDTAQAAIIAKAQRNETFEARQAKQLIAGDLHAMGETLPSTTQAPTPLADFDAESRLADMKAKSDAARSEVGQTLAAAYQAAQDNMPTAQSELRTGIMSEIISQTQLGASHIAQEQTTLSLSEQTSATLLKELLQDADLELATYCAKTGQRVADINPAYLENACRFANLTSSEEVGDKILSRVCSAIERLNQDNASPLWLDTSPENLSALQVFDPQGYAVFTLSKFISLHWSYERKNTHKNTTPREVKQRRFKDRKRAYLAAKRLPANTLTALNEAMRIALGLINPANLEGQNEYFSAFDTIESALLNPESASNFISAIALTIARLLMEKSTKGLLELHPSDFGNLASTYGAFSNYRQQKEWRSNLRGMILNTDAAKMTRILPMLQAFAPALASSASFDAAALAKMESETFGNTAPVTAIKETLSKGIFGAMRTEPAQQISEDELPALFDMIGEAQEQEFSSVAFSLSSDFDDLDDDDFASALADLEEFESMAESAIEGDDDDDEEESNPAIQSLLNAAFAASREPTQEERERMANKLTPKPKPLAHNPLAAAMGQPTGPRNIPAPQPNPQSAKAIFGAKPKPLFGAG